MAVLIGHASIAENGGINGTPGDQTGKEVCIRDWYPKPWDYELYPTDMTIAAKAAQEMRYACNNNNIGYGQNDRRTAYDSAVANGGTFKNAKGNTDCSQLVAGCYKLAGLNISPDCTTRNLRKALLATGKFKEYSDADHLNSDAYATTGAVYLKEGSHVVMALTCGSKAGINSTTGPKPTTPTTGNTVVRDGQIHANNFCAAGLETDGIRGTATKKAGIKVLQQAMNLDYKAGLEVDGVWGPKSEAALGSHYVTYGEKQYMVTACEILLMLKGYNPNGVECPGEFGSGCLAAVKQYQKDNSLSVDGNCGPATFKSLIA